MNQLHSDNLITPPNESLDETERSLRFRKFTAASLIALAAVGCSTTQESSDENTFVSEYPKTMEQAGEMYDDTIVSNLESIYDNLPTSDNPDKWAEEIYGIFNVVYNENRPDLFKYAFGGSLYDAMVDQHVPVIDNATKFKNDPSELDDYIFKVNVISERTDFDGDSGVISVEETRYFKWVTEVATIDMVVGRHDVRIDLPSGGFLTKNLLLIEDWTINERSRSTGE